jgi:predicted  nucleic acid-binding Zn-ribbon protein
MKEQNQRQIQNQTELDERRLRQKKLVRKRKIVLSVMLLTSFLLGCVCGRYFPEIKLGKTEEVLASAQDNSDEEKKENQITNDVDNGTTADGTEKVEQSATETVEEPADSEETNDPFAEIPQVVLSKPVDYSLNQAIRQLEQMEASDERYAQIVENAEKYPEKLLINLANNPEMIAFVADYKGNTRDYRRCKYLYRYSVKLYYLRQQHQLSDY